MVSEDAESSSPTRSSILYLIDGSESMASTGALDKALKAACMHIREAARGGAAAYDAAVLVYNVRGPRQAKNVVTLLDLQEPKIDDLKALIRITDDKAYREEELHPLPGSGGDRLIAAFHVVSNVLNQLHTKSIRRVIIITDNDNPLEGDEKKAKIAANLTHDITNSPAYINPIFLKATSSSKFDVNQFWGTLNYVPPFFAALSDGEGEHRRSSKPQLEPVTLDAFSSPRQTILSSKSRGKFVSLRGKLKIRGLQIGVKGYNIVQPRARTPTGKYIAVFNDGEAKEHYEFVNSEPTTAFAASGTEVDASKQNASQRAFRLSGSVNEADWSVPVSEDEFKSLHKMGDVDSSVLEVQGFVSVPVAERRTIGVVDHSIFIVPSNSISENSERAFASLRRSMCRRGQAAVLTIHHPATSKAAPLRGLAYAAMRGPDQDLKMDSNQLGNSIESLFTAGLFIVPLPFQDDVRRDTTTREESHVDETLCLYLQKMLAKFNMPTGYDPRRFPHPRTAQFAEILERHALNLPLETVKLETGMETVIEQADSTRPRYARIAKGAGKVALEVRKAYMAAAESKGNGLQSGSGTSKPKRRKKTA